MISSETRMKELTPFIIKSRIELSEDEDMKSPAATRGRYDDDDLDDEEVEREGGGEYTLSSQKQRVEVSLEMPQLPIPYSDKHEVLTI